NYRHTLDDGVEGLKIYYSPTLGYAQVDSEVADCVAAAVGVFEQLGATVEEGDPGLGDLSDPFIVLYQGAIAGGLWQYLDEWENEMDPDLVRLVYRGAEYSAVDYIQARLARAAFYDRVRHFFDDYDLLLTPATAVTAFATNQVAPDPDARTVEDMLAWTPFSFPFNASGNPAASVPCGFTSAGLPVGLQIVGPLHNDSLVLRGAASFERVRPWIDARPDL
ncbi:MAG: amidase family protein, partial [Pseudomonadota bacterium]|nr:amidase family protein [Pseudomonadota bacterium]